MHSMTKFIAIAAFSTLAACGNMGREAGYEVDKGQFGNATMHNTMVQNGELEYTVALAERFAKEVPDTVNFAFNSAALTAEARAVLDKQANFIRQFPEVRFKVFGHTDLVGGSSYNKSLGMRRARAVVDYLAARGISKSRLEAVVSYGKTRPLIQTSQPEERNRRTVTEVSGFVKNNPMVLNGKYAAIIWRDYVSSGERAHPSNSAVQSSLAGN